MKARISPQRLYAPVASVRHQLLHCNQREQDGFGVSAVTRVNVTPCIKSHFKPRAPSREEPSVYKTRLGNVQRKTNTEKLQETDVCMYVQIKKSRLKTTQKLYLYSKAQRTKELDASNSFQNSTSSSSFLSH